MQDNLPEKRRGRERLVRIGGVSGEWNRLADPPLERRSRRINKRCWGRVPYRDRDAGDVRCSMIVRHFELHGIDFHLRIGEGGLGGSGIAEGAVPVQVPGIGQGIAGIRIAGGSPIKGDGKRGWSGQRRGLNDGRGGLIAARELDASDSPSIEVHIEQVAPWPNLQVDGIRGAGHKRGSGRRIGQAVRPFEHDPNTIP